MINKKSFSEIQREAIDYLVSNTSITQLDAGGAARSLVDVFSRHLADFYSRLDVDLSMAYLSTASGFYLDLIGKLFGVSRGSSSTVPIHSEDKILKFYTDNGNLLSDYIPGLTISSGTTISTDDGAVSYTVSEDAAFLRMDDYVYVSATAVSSSTYERAGIGTMTTHNLSQTAVSVTNLSPLSSGNIIEDDSDYRARIASSNLGRQGANDTAVRLAALGAPDVADVTISEFSRGSGSFEVMVIPTGNRVPAASLSQIKSRIKSVAAFGVSFDVREPDFIQLKLEMRVKFNNTVSDTQQARLLGNIEAGVLGYIGNLRPGEELSIARIQSVALASSSEVLDAVVTYLCVDKKGQIVRNVRLEDDELFVPDEDSANPIVIRT